MLSLLSAPWATTDLSSRSHAILHSHQKPKKFPSSSCTIWMLSLKTMFVLSVLSSFKCIIHIFACVCISVCAYVNVAMCMYQKAHMETTGQISSVSPLQPPVESEIEFRSTEIIKSTANFSTPELCCPPLCLFFIGAYFVPFSFKWFYIVWILKLYQLWSLTVSSHSVEWLFTFLHHLFILFIETKSHAQVRADLGLLASLLDQPPMY